MVTKARMKLVEKKEESLFQISNEFLDIQWDLLENNGELTEETEKKIGKLKLLFNDKVANIVGLARHMEAMAKSIKEEEARLKALRVSREKAVARLDLYVLTEMQRTGKKRVETDKERITRVLSSRPSISPVDPENVPDVFVKIIPEDRKFDSQKAYAYLKAAELLPKEVGRFEVEGLVIDRKEHLRR